MNSSSLLNRATAQIGALCLMVGICLATTPVWAQADATADSSGSAGGTSQLEVRDLIAASGVIGLVIAVLSVTMVALIVEHLFTVRRRVLMPPGLAEQIHQRIQNRQFAEGIEDCDEQPSLLAHVLRSGLIESDLGYPAVEKAMEDASTERAAAMFRKIEYLRVIGTIAPMLGLLGTVWGMILAFLEFESKANPQVSELAPGIYKALVTTLFGLSVAVPALASFAIFCNRIEQFVAETALLAEHVFADFKRARGPQQSARFRQKLPEATSPQEAAPRPTTASTSGSEPPRIPPVTIERERRP